MTRPAGFESDQTVRTKGSEKRKMEKKKRRYKSGTLVKRAIKKAQRGNSYGAVNNDDKERGMPLIARNRVKRLVREIGGDHSSSPLRWKGKALSLLHGAAEEFICNLMQDANVVARCGDKKTIEIKHFRAVQLLRKNRGI